MRPITDIVIVGSGNVAEALAAAVAAAEDVVLRGVAARNGARAAEIADMAGGVWHGPIGEAPDADLYLIAVSDRAVAERHEAMLEGEPLHREIYRLLTEYIWETSRRI